MDAFGAKFRVYLTLIGLNMVLETQVRNKGYSEIIQEIWEEDESLRKNAQVLIISSNFGKIGGLDLARDRKEVKLRRKFVNECPEGHEVDHIIPVSKGGQNHLSNLQWLPKKLNVIKRDNIYLENFFFPHCPINVKEKIEKMSISNRKEEILKKLALDINLEENLLHSLCEAVLRFKKLSPSYIIRKLKVDFDRAKLLCEKINNY